MERRAKMKERKDETKNDVVVDDQDGDKKYSGDRPFAGILGISRHGDAPTHQGVQREFGGGSRHDAGSDVASQILRV